MSQAVRRYFPEISVIQAEKFEALLPLYREWNSKINVISRKDIDNFEIHHLLHSLGIAGIIKFHDSAKILDAGTGGGFPGIPLAIMFPEIEFTLVDSIKKKTLVAGAVSEELSLTNVRVICSRVEDLQQKFDFVVSRAVTAFPKFVSWVSNSINPGVKSSLPNGILSLKGGDLGAEIEPFQGRVKIFELENVFEEDYFKSKKVVFLPI